MADTPRPAIAASLTLKFADAETLAEALASYAGQLGLSGLCIQVLKYYELGDAVQLRVEYEGQAPLGIRGVVAWRKPGYIGVRFTPASAEENRSFKLMQQLLGEARGGSRVPPPVADGTKPFAE